MVFFSMLALAWVELLPFYLQSFSRQFPFFVPLNSNVQIADVVCLTSWYLGNWLRWLSNWFFDIRAQLLCRINAHKGDITVSGGGVNLTASVVIYIKLFPGEQLTMSGVIQQFSGRMDILNCDITRNSNLFQSVM